MCKVSKFVLDGKVVNGLPKTDFLMSWPPSFSFDEGFSTIPNERTKKPRRKNSKKKTKDPLHEQ